jgi:hypothetical protein
MIFYGLFLHHGENVLFHIPGDIPLLSGIVSLNSILYGFFLGGSLALSVFMFSLFSNFLRDQRPRFYFTGIGADLSLMFSFLSYFVSYFLNHFDLFNLKIKNRRLNISILKRMKLFMHDASFHAMENAFSYAETLEMLGFSAKVRKTSTKYDVLTAMLAIGTLIGLFLYRLQHHIWQLLVVVGMSISLGILFKKIKQQSLVSQKYDYSMSWNDWIVMIWSLSFLVICLFVTFHSQSFLSRESISEYFRFDWIIQGCFLLHALMATLFFGLKRIDE